MRNDSRLIGEDSPASPVGGDASPETDRRNSHTQDRQPNIVNREAEERQPDSPDERRRDESRGC